ncbi:Arginine biosynthesis bifunctional protein ArgJ 1, mitochondrial [Smittium culicis]|uniref:Arginine biosynthesis bifunctional protein ArgJ, mitochondrial n=1 Tax=Smittium culicis TaxID=133412 RepID=A0A1R1YR91_9FUNG|nr:Arginine biosynthesis bifunctional protein ArgJ 1, mitochondrial [Smittium culicis]
MSSIFFRNVVGKSTTAKISNRNTFMQAINLARFYTTDYSVFPEPKQRHIPRNGTYPVGFLAGSTYCGIKNFSDGAGSKDLTMIMSTVPCIASAVFTKNQVAAAPVQIDRKLLDTVRTKGISHIRAVISNSGVANAVTGEQGFVNCNKMANASNDFISNYDKKNATYSDINAEISKSIVLSTGVIGKQLPIEKIETGVLQLEGKLGDSHTHWIDTAIGYMTTDTFPKLHSKEFTLPSNGAKYRLCGISKGAGMIHPNMATMLCTLVSDVSITQELLDNAVTYAADRSFNCISIDGDTSTNDTFSVLANGLASSPSSSNTTTSNASEWKISDEKSEDFLSFRDNLTEFSKHLAQLIVRDGEGATKFITINISNASSPTDAKAVGVSIAKSPLVKTAFFGQDANWGRILCAIGYSSAKIDPSTVSLRISSTPSNPSGNVADSCIDLLVNGQPLELDEAKASAILAHEDLTVDVDLGLGSDSATIYTCDFSHEYVSINGDYRT